MAEFKLSAVLKGHDDDVSSLSTRGCENRNEIFLDTCKCFSSLSHSKVRAVIFPSPKAVISASRDGTVRVWNHISGPPPTFDNTISSHGNGFINAVAYVPPSAEYPDGLIISGGQETIIDVRAPGKAPDDNAEALLLGHSGNVCSLDVDPAGKFVVSGSWDAEARIWPVGRWNSEIVLKGHEGSVWGVLVYDSETIITACADQIIRVFHTSGKLLKKIKGSEGVVRALCRIPKGHPSGADFASTGNDGVLRFWTLSGQQIAAAHGHDNYVYSLATLPTGELVTSGEDRSVRIWKGTECVQTITLPAISIWGVAVCAETGDIASGDSNNTVHVWSRDPERIAAADVVSAFKESVQASVIPQEAAAPNINKTDLPGPDFIKNKSGTKEGQVQMIHESNGDINAYQWSMGQGEWVKIGAVVSSATGGGKKDYLGQEYDYVFDVDIEEGKPPLKLPFNVTQNPYDAATKFITDNELPGAYLDQVAEFIITNTQGATLETAQPGPPDPWGSDSRYRPGDGGSSAPATAPRSLPAPIPKILPQTEYLSIIVGRYDQMQKKIVELNSALVSSGEKEHSLNPTELSTLSNVIKHLSASGATSTSQTIAGGLSVALKLSLDWPYADRLPGLDLLRLLAVAPDSATFKHPRCGNLVDCLTVAVTEKQPPAENHVMMAVRAFGNLFESREGRALALQEFAKIQSLVASSVASSSNRNLLVAATTLYINYAVLFNSSEGAGASFEPAVQMLETLVEILKRQKDAEVVYRALVATGSLLFAGEEIKSAAKEVYGVANGVNIAVANAKGDMRVKNVGKEISGLLK